LLEISQSAAPAIAVLLHDNSTHQESKIVKSCYHSFYIKLKSIYYKCSATTALQRKQEKQIEAGYWLSDVFPSCQIVV